MIAEIIDGRALARQVVEQVKAGMAVLPRTPGLAVILAGDDPASHVYVNSKTKLAREIGFLAEVIALPRDATEERVLAEVAKLNARGEIDGILVQLPLPNGINTLRVMAAIDPGKDVDGLHALNAGLLSQGAEGLIPCTPLGCMKIIQSILPDLTGQHAVVIGSSNIVGKPGLVRGDWIKPRALVIDVGTTRVEKPEGGHRIVGDVAFAEVSEVAGAITPVPGGVGPMTIACLMENTLKAARSRLRAAGHVIPDLVAHQ